MSYSDDWLSTTLFRNIIKALRNDFHDFDFEKSKITFTMISI